MVCAVPSVAHSFLPFSRDAIHKIVVFLPACGLVASRGRSSQIFNQEACIRARYRIKAHGFLQRLLEALARANTPTQGSRFGFEEIRGEIFFEEIASAEAPATNIKADIYAECCVASLLRDFAYIVSTAWLT
jgi:hypothetical protein